MSKFFLILSAFAMIVSVTICASHAHASVDSASDISISIEIDNAGETSLGSNGCDMSCGGCCVHHAMSSSFVNSDFISLSKGKLLRSDGTLFVSDITYGLKRPPKS